MTNSEKVWVVTISIIVVVVCVLSLWFFPVYSVWTAEQEGKAMLARANYAKESQVADAKAKLESSKYLAEAATTIESSLTPGYLYYLKIQMMEHIGEQNQRAVYFYDSKAPDLTVPVNP